MDFDSGLCVGCQRTIAEIAAWSKADDAQKAAILLEVAKRRQGQQPVVETKS